MARQRRPVDDGCEGDPGLADDGLLSGEQAAVRNVLQPGSLISGIKAIVFESAGNAFEVDNVAFGTRPGTPASVPEPATVGLFGIGLAALGRRVMKKRSA